MLWHIGHARVSVSPHICATHIRGSGQFSGLSLPAGRKTHLDPSWVTPLRPWPTLLDKLTTIIPPSLFVSPIRSLVLAPALFPSLSFFSPRGESTCRILFSFGFSSLARRGHLPYERQRHSIVYRSILWVSDSFCDYLETFLSIFLETLGAIISTTLFSLSPSLFFSSFKIII